MKNSLYKNEIGQLIKVNKNYYKITYELRIRNLKDKEITPYVQQLNIEIEAIEKGGYDHFMLKEIFEQPETIFDCLRGRLLHEQNQIIMAGVDHHIEALTNASRIMIVACGTSWHAGLVAEYLIEELCRIPVEVEYGRRYPSNFCFLHYFVPCNDCWLVYIR